MGTLQLVGEQAQSAVFPGEDPAKGQFLARVLKEFWQTDPQPWCSTAAPPIIG